MKRNNWLKSIILGTKDYIKDTKHEHLCGKVAKIGCRVYEETTDGEWRQTSQWKEGSIWHYIRQRRLAGRNKLWSIDNEIKTIDDLWQFMQSVVEDMPKTMTPDDYKFMITACKDIIRIAKKKGWGK